jgi:hypothetical protein
MKTHFTRHLKILYALWIGFLVISSQIILGGEFVILNKTYTYPANGGAFDCNTRDYSSMPPNWLYPDDYWNGHFYGYFELIDIPSNYTVGFQIGIYQYYLHDGKNYYETCSYAQAQLQGAGDVTQVDYGSPANWWQHPNGAVDFTKVNEFEEVGLVIWSHMPNHEGIICPTSSGGDDIAYEVHDQFMPCTIRVILVAVSAGSSFSGWDNYLDGGGGCTPAKQATPTYSIDFGNETTNKSVPSTDEYSYYSDMSGAMSGSGQKLHLTPGTDIYFRTRASGECWLTSDIQHLAVPDRPSMPEFSVDFVNEKTLENVSSAIVYSTSSSYTNPVNGTGAKVSLTPGQDLYLWVNSTSSDFASMDYHLIVPDRPTLEYTGENTVSTEFISIHAALDEGMTNFDLADISVTNGYARNLLEDGTFEAVAGSVGEVQVIIPANSFGGASFASNRIVVNFEGNPTGKHPTPDYGIDYYFEATNKSVPSADEYSSSSDMSDAISGNGNKLSLNPGQDLYFRTKEGGGLFASDIQHLIVPERPEMPLFSIDYINEKTMEDVNTNITYSTSSNYSDQIIGSGIKIALTPGQNLYLWVSATSGSFASMDFHLVVPARPILEYSGEDTVTSEAFSIHAILDEGMNDFDPADISVINGFTQNLQEDNLFEVVPESQGEVHVVIPANSFGGASFRSNEIVVYYEGISTAYPQYKDNIIGIYPNPNKTGMVYIKSKASMYYAIDIYSASGSFIRTISLNKDENRQINLQDLNKGMYFLKIHTTYGVQVEKLILE